MLILRIRQAEVALSDGRLDEACELCQSDKLRSHRKGQALVTRLVRALVKRGHAHLGASRPQQALVDCEKAARLGGNLAEVVELRGVATDEIAEKQRDERRRAQAFAMARQHIDAGRLAAGQQLLAQAGSESRAAVLLQDVHLKRAMVEQAIQSAQAALERDDLDAAAAELVKARHSDASDARVIELCAQVCQTMKKRIGTAINDGRLDLAETLVQRLAKLDDQSIEAQQFQKGVEQYRLAWTAIDRGEPRPAGEILRRLSNLFPDAKWAKDAVKHVENAEGALEALRAGPLGLLSSTAVRGDAPTEVPMPPSRGMAVPATHSPPQRQAHGRDAHATAEALPTKFMIQIDGAGTFYVLRAPLVTMGPVSSSRLPDVGLIAEPGAPVVSIERSEDDYFIRATSAIAVNDRPTNSKLLMRGDRIAISPRCRLTFNLPNPASTSATVDLAGGRFPRGDVRRVILLDRDLIIGPGNGAHVRADHLPGNVMLVVRDGRLLVQSDAHVTVDGRPMDRLSGIPLGGHVDVGGSLSFVITQA